MRRLLPAASAAADSKKRPAADAVALPRTAGAVVAAVLAVLGLACVAVPMAFAQERAYELVTPPGSDGEVRIGGGMATPDGDVVCFNAETVLAGSTPNGYVTADDGFCATRTSSGWDTEWVTGPLPEEPHGGRGAQIYWVSPGGERVVFASDMGLYPDYQGQPPPSASAAGTVSGFMWEGGEMPRWLTPTPYPIAEERPVGQPPGARVEREPVAASEDLTHGLFYSSIQLLPEDGNDERDVYEWHPGGIRLVSRDASGSAVGGMPPFVSDGYQMLAEPGTISRDGSRVFFHHTGALAGSPAGVKSVFMREGDDLTHVSPRQGPGPAQDVRFVGASEGGKVVYLLTAEQLTGEPKLPGDALYRYEIGSGDLTLVASAVGGVFFLGVSADGSAVVYRTGTFGLFVNRDGVDHSLGMLFPTDTVDLFDAVANPRSDKRALRVARDGESVVFASSGGFAGTVPGTKQVYRWTPEAGVVRLSAPAAGTPPAGEATIGNSSTVLSGFPRQAILNTMRERPNLGRVTTDDGETVFFETLEQLVDADVNSFVDVYQWRDGELSLISPGDLDEHALYHDSSADGSTVFFTTYARVIPQLDRNVSRDLYAARVGGGFPLPEIQTECEGSACQGAPPAPAQRGAPASKLLEGAGNVRQTAPQRGRHRVARLTARQRRALARQGQTAIRVRVSRAGRVRAVLVGRVAGRNVRLARSSRRAAGRGVVRLRLRLTRRGRRVMERRERVRAVLRVGYSRSSRTVRQRLVLRG